MAWVLGLVAAASVAFVLLRPSPSSGGEAAMGRVMENIVVLACAAFVALIAWGMK